MDFDDLDEAEAERATQPLAAPDSIDTAAAPTTAAVGDSAAAESIDSSAPAQGVTTSVPDETEPPEPGPPRWEIVGGADKGGILVRDGGSTTATQLAERLSTGALVEQLHLKGDRLQYRLVKGTGPPEGWVSIKLKDKELAVPVVEIGVDGPKRLPPPWRRVKQPEISYADMKTVMARDEPGDYYGIRFPCSKDQLVELGPAWLTQAFHKSGVLPRTNAVTRISDAREFVGGGAGLKCTFTVEYKVDEPYLHKNLFAKIPHKPVGSDRYYVSCMWDHDRPEMIFNIFLQQYVPFRVPKFYFGDICASTTNFILITEAIPWAEKGRTNFGPGEIEPAYDKFMDWELPDGGPMYYLACCRALGKMAAYHKMGKLHPDVNQMFPMPDQIPSIPDGLPGADAATRKQNAAKAEQFAKFVSETARKVMPPEIVEPGFLQNWQSELLDVMDFVAEITCFCSGAGTPNPHDWVALTHKNLQIDNAFFWRNGAGDLEVGLLDWGILACGPLAEAIQGCISGAQVEVLLEHRDAFLQAFLDSYAAEGGPRLDLERLRMMSNLHMALWCGSIISNVTHLLKTTKLNEWADISDWMDSRLVGRFQTRAHATQFRNALQLWRAWDLYGKFNEWKASMKLPQKKG